MNTVYACKVLILFIVNVLSPKVRTYVLPLSLMYIESPMESLDVSLHGSCTHCMALYICLRCFLCMTFLLSANQLHLANFLQFLLGGHLPTITLQVLTIYN